MLDACEWQSDQIGYQVSSIEHPTLLFHCPVAKGCAAGFFSIFDLLFWVPALCGPFIYYFQFSVAEL